MPDRDESRLVTVTCSDCGSTQSIPALKRGGTAACFRCDRVLARHTFSPLEVPLACAIAVFILLPPAVFMPLMESTIRNLVFEESRLASSVPVIYSEVWFPFAFGFLFCAFLFPALRAAFQILVLGSLRLGWKLWRRGQIFRWSEELRVWSMTDLVVVAGIIAYYRAEISAQVEIGVGALIYIAVAVIAFAGDQALDRRAVWNGILPDRAWVPDRELPSCDVCELTVTKRRAGDPCPRCGAKLDRSINPRFVPAVAALAAALPLCIPAYAASVMVNDQLTGVLEHTVVGTVQLLADRGYWHIGVVVLFAGIVVPTVELFCLSWLLIRTKFPRSEGLVLRTRLYRLLHRMARWPMIIPFIAAIAAPIVDFRGIDDIVAGPGATPLFMLIILIMATVRLFEPRLMWKAAGEAA